MMPLVEVIAHPNIALAKYWGKSASGSNVPAVPSLSVTLAGMRTRTRLRFVEAGLSQDQVRIGGVLLTGAESARSQAMLDTVRAAAGLDAFAEVHSDNDFPTASGLASSASGFAALALASVRAAGLDWDLHRVSELARCASASAGRSLFGGFVAMVPQGDHCRTEPVAPETALDLSVLVCVVTEEAKAVSSRVGMNETSARSPFYQAWLGLAPQNFEALRAALNKGDFDLVGKLSEQSALAMHASALAANVVYLRGVSLDLLEAVRALRAKGLMAYATMDAGPHVKVLVQSPQADQVRAALAQVPGVLRTIHTRPGPGARVVPASEAP
jgi:diphosphomevalonate decarboxylase